MKNQDLIGGTLASGEPTAIRATAIAYIHPRGDAGCLVTFSGGAWVLLGDTYETILARWRAVLRQE